MKEPDAAPDSVITGGTNWKTVLRSVAYILFTIVTFLFALELMLAALQHLGQPAEETILLATTNPFTAFFIGLLLTAIIQSSTATTSITVALVASGSLTLQSAVPIVMGANIGTTITSTIVSLSFLPKKNEFRRALAAGSYHDFFNMLTAAVLFPLEYHFQFLSRSSQHIASYFIPPTGGKPVTHISLLYGGLDGVTEWIGRTIDNGFVLIILALGILFGSILFFRNVLTRLLGIGSLHRFRQFFFQNAWKSFGWGALTTAAIRSSTITTSLVVPLVAKKVVKLRNAAPFIAGANVGTTISAFVAATVSSNTAISIAIAHLLFNIIGVILFVAIPVLREIPLWLASGLGRLTVKYRMAGLVYLVVLFLLIPFTLIYFNRDTEPSQKLLPKPAVLQEPGVAKALAIWPAAASPGKK
ncbi:MAG: Na/Pi symporter [Cytophagales bacterium]|nr:Na/Pi symporter [Cytophagales bacterium]